MLPQAASVEELETNIRVVPPLLPKLPAKAKPVTVLGLLHATSVYAVAVPVPGLPRFVL